MQLQAVFEGGVIRLLEPVDLLEGELIEVILLPRNGNAGVTTTPAQILARIAALPRCRAKARRIISPVRITTAYSTRPMNKPALVDTGAWFALVVPSESRTELTHLGGAASGNSFTTLGCNNQNK